MHITDLLKEWNVPEKCLVDRVVPKTAFAREGLVGKSAQELLSAAVAKIRISATFKPATINLSPYRDEEREYDEVHYISVYLKELKKVSRVAELIHQTIPYPLLILFESEERILLSAAMKRTNQADESKNTVELTVDSGWFGNGGADLLLNALKIENLDFANAYAFYRNIVDALIMHNARQKYKIGTSARNGDKLKLFKVMEEIAGYEREIGSLRAEYKRTDRMGEKVDLNMRMQGLKTKKMKLIDSIED